MAAEPVPPVADNEREARIEAIWQRLNLLCANEFDAALAAGEEEFDWTDAYADDVRFVLTAYARLVAALSAATTERDEARAQLGEEALISVGRLGEADYQRERAEALAAQLQQAREALSWALDSLELAFKRLDSVDEYSPEHYLIRQAGFDKARAALAAAAPATTLNEPDTDSEPSTHLIRQAGFDKARAALAAASPATTEGKT